MPKGTNRYGGILGTKIIPDAYCCIEQQKYWQACFFVQMHFRPACHKMELSMLNGNYGFKALKHEADNVLGCCLVLFR
uniref:Uncharacterized protein n=1 Tax=Oryza brachyantha TaxID=4533 RepID=J3MQG1_ORYBR